MSISPDNLSQSEAAVHHSSYPLSNIRSKEERQPQEEPQPLETTQSEWTYNSWLHEYEDKKVADSIKKKHLALTWQNLQVTGVDSQAVFADDVLSFANPISLLRGSRNAGTVVSEDMNLSRRRW